MNELVLNQLFDKIEQEHFSNPANISQVEAALSKFRRDFGFFLPSDLVYFYNRFHEADIFDHSFIMQPINEIYLAGSAIYGQPDMLPNSWFAFCKNGEDGNYFVIDLDYEDRSYFPILDLDHEDISYDVIAMSFTEFISDVLKYASETDPLYWFKDRYGDSDPSATKGVYGRAHTIEHFSLEEWELRFIDSEKLETGQERCKINDCERKHIPLSVMCDRHHAEMLLYPGVGAPKTDVPATAVYTLSRPRINTL
ncbi:MAG: SMI1/KNR4 family protein [Candidatus Obscuribacterales bacterium]|nr:SMI1/KNR4 family protein [Candidatus Obscuribacterales bacterium]